MWEHFCKEVSNIVFGRDISDRNFPSLDCLMNLVVFDVSMFDAAMSTHILH